MGHAFKLGIEIGIVAIVVLFVGAFLLGIARGTSEQKAKRAQRDEAVAARERRVAYIRDMEAKGHGNDPAIVYERRLLGLEPRQR